MPSFVQDAVAYLLCACPECGHEWREEMTELATGYDHCYGEDEPEECPECGHGAEPE